MGLNYLPCILCTLSLVRRKYGFNTRNGWKHLAVTMQEPFDALSTLRGRDGTDGLLFAPGFACVWLDWMIIDSGSIQHTYGILHMQEFVWGRLRGNSIYLRALNTMCQLFTVGLWCPLPHSIFPTALQGRYLYVRFTDEETEA